MEGNKKNITLAILFLLVLIISVQLFHSNRDQQKVIDVIINDFVYDIGTVLNEITAIKKGEELHHVNNTYKSFIKLDTMLKYSSDQLYYNDYFEMYGKMLERIIDHGVVTDNGRKNILLMEKDLKELFEGLYSIEEVKIIAPSVKEFNEQLNTYLTPARKQFFIERDIFNIE